ncbi:CHAD domain-containing protein [Streptomyces sp. PLAI1-29]|uniref:CHAD domain-containing protein n=1 Tax=Streptomyces zingiberis TaxID=2053010 RepID=A0ABX1BQQ5_9ACTN|nr:CHAD domain-containing protein [Streptomyces zingiberis]NJQ00047.1 CHAD domain-containing protein [Streptomyces zingiberis]
MATAAWGLAGRTAGEVLAAWLHAGAGEFLRGLRLYRESGSDAGEAAPAALRMRRSARRVAGALHTYRALTDTGWADPLQAELTWLATVLAREHACAQRLDRLGSALHRLSGAEAPGAATAGGTGTAENTAAGHGAGADHGTAAGPGTPAALDGATAPDAGAAPYGGTSRDTAPPAAAPSVPPSGPLTAPLPAPLPAPNGAADGDADGAGHPRVVPQRRDSASPRSALTMGAARAGALLERRLTLARTRAHSAALQALGSSRFHALVDAMALLASDAPLNPATAGQPAQEVLPPPAEEAFGRLAGAVAALPLGRATQPYNAEALSHALAATASADAPPAAERQDAHWHHVRLLVRHVRYARESLDRAGAYELPPPPDSPLAASLLGADEALRRHRDAAEAAAEAAAAARTPRIAPATAYALGVLHADQRHDVEAARLAFGRAWQRVTATGW